VPSRNSGKIKSSRGARLSPSPALSFFYLLLRGAHAVELLLACSTCIAARPSASILISSLLPHMPQATTFKRAPKQGSRQEVAFFDQHTSTGEVVRRMSGDTVLIQDSMGEKVDKFVQLLAVFLSGFAVAFAQGWLLTLVMLATIPPLVPGRPPPAATAALPLALRPSLQARPPPQFKHRAMSPPTHANSLAECPKGEAFLRFHSFQFFQ
jgi:ABC-type multidrug transport system fused ATPase/permease subunit